MVALPAPGWVIDPVNQGSMTLSIFRFTGSKFLAIYSNQPSNVSQMNSKVSIVSSVSKDAIHKLEWGSHSTRTSPSLVWFRRNPAW